MKFSLNCLLHRFQRVFNPTIPTRRVKKEPRDSEDHPTSTELDSKPCSRRGFSNGDKERSSRRDRKRDKREMIASASVFSLGPAERTAQRRKGGEHIFCYAYIYLPIRVYIQMIVSSLEG